MKNFIVTFEKTFTYQQDVKAENEQEAKELVRNMIEEDMDNIEHSQEGYWEYVDTEEVENGQKTGFKAL